MSWIVFKIQLVDDMGQKLHGKLWGALECLAETEPLDHLLDVVLASSANVGKKPVLALVHLIG